MSINLQRSASAPSVLQHVTQAEEKEKSFPAATLARNESAPELSDKLFDKYVFRKDQLIPENLDLRGAICIERDSKHSGWLHKLMFLVQKIHQVLSHIFGWREGEFDPNLCHGSIIINRVKNKDGQYDSNTFIGNHALLSTGGVSTTTMHFERDNLTELVIYVPKTEALRRALINNSKQTCYDNRAKNGHTNADRISPFATGDLARCSFHSNRKPDERIMRRTARAVADLLQGNQFLNKKGDKPRQFFCMPYVTTVLTTGLLASSLTNDERYHLKYDDQGKLRSRDELANLIFNQMRDPNSSLGKAFRTNPINQIDTRFLGTAYIANLFDKASANVTDYTNTEELPVINSSQVTAAPTA